MPEWCGYLPVCIDPREGAQAGELQNALVKITPSLARASILGDSTYPSLLSFVPVLAWLKQSKASAR